MCRTECGPETNVETTPSAQGESMDQTDVPQHNSGNAVDTEGEPVPRDQVSDDLLQTLEDSPVGKEKEKETENTSKEAHTRDTESPTANLRTKLGKALFQSLQPDVISDTGKEIGNQRDKNIDFPICKACVYSHSPKLQRPC